MLIPLPFPLMVGCVLLFTVKTPLSSLMMAAPSAHGVIDGGIAVEVKRSVLTSFFTAVPVFFTSSVPSALKVPVLLIPILFSFTVRVFPAARVTLPALLIPFDALFVMFKPVRILISPPAYFLIIKFICRSVLLTFRRTSRKGQCPAVADAMTGVIVYVTSVYHGTGLFTVGMDAI